ncbi:5-oxoprolinase subunit PxpB [Desulfotalea psychrophila]|uniref:Carboxyltransferase domain-containing protein n=1 Tax=Desulfotalea psychrophila (strain LSv54 / DSM 12343) TaxID=177439 RepID=Q6ANH4_DESPS|nr:5-oxoprolinase subunit PxpB [Desulfotalea psychrophila]CAG36100.1 conserved hypothetical protein [Desulfotalea psychrophila LSv54]
MHKKTIPYTISPVSENSLLIKYGETASTTLSLYIASCARVIEAELGESILNIIASYNALLITFKPYLHGDFLAQVEASLAMEAKVESGRGKIIEIPTYYNHEVAEYLDEITADMNLSLEELIAGHTASPFFVYMLGFCPGYAYMGDLPKQMQLPRRKTPQLKIPVGSVAIADFQTAIYPIEMPGGWHIIGRTPTTVFDSKREQPSLFQQGDMVQFKSINRDEFLALGGIL